MTLVANNPSYSKKPRPITRTKDSKMMPSQDERSLTVQEVLHALALEDDRTPESETMIGWVLCHLKIPYERYEAVRKKAHGENG